MDIALDLDARYSDFHLAVADRLHVEGVTALFGPSGAGKSTILAAIAGFRPGIGRIAVDGHSWQDTGRSLPAHRRPVGMVFQDGRLFDHLDVAGNLRFAERRADRSGPAISREAVIGALDLGGLLVRSTPDLSGGERQRVAIARALLTRPRLLLMDEPLAALDRVRKAAILPLIAGLPTTFGLPVLFVSHQLDEIAQIADRMIAVHGGCITGQGPADEMIASLDAAVSGHFEAGVLVSGRVEEVDAAHAVATVRVGENLLIIPDTGGAVAGAELRLRLRARDISIALKPVAGLSIRNQLPAVIKAIEADAGPFAEVHLDCRGTELRARLTRLAIAELGLAPDQNVTALIKSVAFDRRLTLGGGKHHIQAGEAGEEE